MLNINISTIILQRTSESVNLCHNQTIQTNNIFIFIFGLFENYFYLQMLVAAPTEDHLATTRPDEHDRVFRAPYKNNLLASMRYFTPVHWTSHFLQGI